MFCRQEVVYAFKQPRRGTYAMNCGTLQGRSQYGGDYELVEEIDI